MVGLMGMIGQAWWLVAGAHVLLPLAGAEDAPEVLVDKVRTPWGTVVDHTNYYLKDGKRVEHGLVETSWDDGVLLIRSRWAHGHPHGLYQLFYDGSGAKQTETMYVDGLEHGPSRTWGPDGELLFEGVWRNGDEWDGWFDQSSTSSSGVYHRHGMSWKVVQWKEGKKVRGSRRVVKVDWRGWERGRSPDQRMFCRWPWLEPEQAEGYPFANVMPDDPEVPSLIERCAKKEAHYRLAWEQLMALTRVSFGNPWLQKDEERTAATVEWREWWQDVGRHRTAERKKRGERDQEAWDLVRGGRDLPVPEKAVVIPETYSLEVHFRSGDYGGVTSEALTIKRSQDGAELVRRFSTVRDGPVTEERWLPFGPEEADRVVRALGYLIDEPWLLNDEQEIERRFWNAEKKNPKGEPGGGLVDETLKGRPSFGRPYYPSAGFSLRDGDGKLWWNAEVDRWYGANPERFNHSQQPVPGVVYPFLARRYPESARRAQAGQRGWK